jgi:hypothetical protein
MLEASIIMLFELQSLFKFERPRSSEWISRPSDVPVGNVMFMHKFKALDVRMKINKVGQCWQVGIP